MSRIIDALSQFSDGNGQPLAGGYLKFFENETAIPADTFNDPDETVVNPVKVPLDGEGRMALNAYASVLLTVKLFNSSDSQVDSEDNVTPRGGLTSGNAFADWMSSINYKTGISVVTGSDGNYYKAKQDNKDVDPVVDFAGDSDTWERVYFNEFWSKAKNYVVGDRVTFITDLQNYICVNANINTDPSVNVASGGSKWELDQPTLEWASGRLYKIGEKAYSKVDNRLYKSTNASPQSGNEPSADSGTNWLPTDGVVVKPVNVLPADLATGVSRNPTLTTDAYAVSGSLADHEYSVFELSDDSFSTVFYTSDITNDLTSHDVLLKLPSATTFEYRMLMKGIRTDLSVFSNVTTFTTVFPLSASFSNDLVVGTALARTLVTGVDLSTQSGFIFIANKDTVDPMRLCSTTIGAGSSVLMNSSSFGVTAEATGLTSFNVNGYSVGVLAAYNGSGNDIFSLIFQQIAKFSDLVQYSGTELNRTVPHGLTTIPGVYITIKLSGAGNGSFYTRHNAGVSSTDFVRFGKDDAEAISSDLFNTLPATATEFSLGTNTVANAIGSTYLALVLANDASTGIVTGEYTGTGAGGNKIVTTFQTGTFIAKNLDSVEDWFIFDVEMGTSTHIVFDATAQSGAGGVQSFDSDGITLNTIANTSGDRYFYIAIANKDTF